MEKQILALGFFDGVHIGHQALLKECCRMAKENNCAAGVVTFDNHPVGVITGTFPGLVCTLRDRKTLLHQYGMDQVTVLHFDHLMRSVTYAHFFRTLVEKYNAAGFVCGEDYRFGAQGRGNAQTLQELCRNAGLPCTVVPRQTLDGNAFSSSLIRSFIETGHMSQAVRYLGHPYLLTGTVVHGHQLGRKLGIPTANLMLPKELIVPKFGVYACVAQVDGKRYPAVTNIGTRPTVAGIGITVEPWILDYEGDLYGREITLEFYCFLRPEQRFSTLEALQQEIRRNAQDAREILKEVSQATPCTEGKNVVE